MEGFITFLLVIGAIVLAGMLFCAWVVVVIVRGLWRMILPKRRDVETVSNLSVQVCGNPQCGCSNPAQARFCRRCGRSLPSLLKIVSSRVAML